MTWLKYLSPSQPVSVLLPTFVSLTFVNGLSTLHLFCLTSVFPTRIEAPRSQGLFVCCCSPSTECSCAGRSGAARHHVPSSSHTLVSQGLEAWELHSPDSLLTGLQVGFCQQDTYKIWKMEEQLSLYIPPAAMD